MTSYSNYLPSRIYMRRDLGNDPPSIAFGLDLMNHMTEGGVVSFIDDEIDPVRDFDLLRLRGAFRISRGLTPPWGTFASPEAAIRAGWAAVDTAEPDLPPLNALLSQVDTTGGAA